MLVFHWPEVSHMATPGSKGCWKCKYLNVLLQPPAGAGKGGWGVWSEGTGVELSNQLPVRDGATHILVLQMRSWCQGQRNAYSISSLIDLLRHSGPATRDAEIKATPLPSRERRRIIIVIITI